MHPKAIVTSFVDANVDSWDAHFFDPQNPETPAYYDLTLTETKRLDNLAPVLREFTDRLVGWSRWLLLNETAPPAWSPCSFYFKLSGDMSEIPVL